MEGIIAHDTRDPTAEPMNSRRYTANRADLFSPTREQWVNTGRGLVRIEEAELGEEVRTATGWGVIVGKQAVAKQEKWVMVELANGMAIPLPVGRQVRSLGAWVSAGELQPGSPVYISRHRGAFGKELGVSLNYTNYNFSPNQPTLPTEWSVELAELAGYFIAKGHCHYHKGRVSSMVLNCYSRDNDLREYLSRNIAQIFGKAPQEYHRQALILLQVLSNDIAGAFDQLCNAGSGISRVPEGIWRAPEAVVAGFLRGYIEGDAGICGKNGMLISSAHVTMLRDVQQLLLMFGMHSNIWLVKPGNEKQRNVYGLRISSTPHQRVYLEQIGWLSAWKRGLLGKYVQSRSAADPHNDPSITLPAGFDLAGLKPAVYKATRASGATISDSLTMFFGGAAKRLATSNSPSGKPLTITLHRMKAFLELLEHPEWGTTQELPQLSLFREVITGWYYETHVVSLIPSTPQPSVQLAIAPGIRATTGGAILPESYLLQGVVVRDSGVQPKQPRKQQPAKVQAIAANGHTDAGSGAWARLQQAIATSQTATPSCLMAGTMVNTEHGLVRIEQTEVGDTILTADGVRKIVGKKVVPDTAASTPAPTAGATMLKLRLANGITLCCGPQQQLRGSNRWITAQSLVVGDLLYASMRPGIFGTKTGLQLRYTTTRPMSVWGKQEIRLPSAVTVGLAELVGYMLGHCMLSKNKGLIERLIITFAPEDEDLVKYFEPCIANLFGRYPVRRRSPQQSPQLQLFSTDVCMALLQLGMEYKVAQRIIPNAIFCAPKPIVAAVLRGYFESRVDIRETSFGGLIQVIINNPTMAANVQQLLSLFGIYSTWTIQKEHKKRKDGRQPSTIELRIIGERSKRLMIEQIGVISNRRRQIAENIQQSLAALPEMMEGRTETLTIPRDHDIEAFRQAIIHVRNSFGRSAQQRAETDAVRDYLSNTGLATGHQSTLRLLRIAWMIQHLPDEVTATHIPFLYEAHQRAYAETTVESIEEVPAEPMVELQVEGHGEFLANRVVVRGEPCLPL